jgi:hypothetical protein
MDQSTRRPGPPPRGVMPSNPRGHDNPEAVREAMRAEQERVRRLAAEQDAADLRDRLDALERKLEERAPATIEPPSSRTQNEAVGRVVTALLKKLGALVLAGLTGAGGVWAMLAKTLDAQAVTARQLVVQDTAEDKRTASELEKLRRAELDRRDFDRKWQDYQIQVWEKQGVRVPRPERPLNVPEPEPVEVDHEQTRPPRGRSPAQLVIETVPPAPPR